MVRAVDDIYVQHAAVDRSLSILGLDAEGMLAAIG